MMNGREKSGPAVVALKPANKVGQPAAELVEPRAGAEGNASQSRARRAQNRDRAIRGLSAYGKSQCVLPSRPEVGAGCGVREESWNELASESLVRSKPSRQDGSESCGRRGNAGSEA